MKSKVNYLLCKPATIAVFYICYFQAALNSLTEDITAAVVTIENFQKAMATSKASLTPELITQYKNMCKSRTI